MLHSGRIYLSFIAMPLSCIMLVHMFCVFIIVQELVITESSVWKNDDCKFELISRQVLLSMLVE